MCCANCNPWNSYVFDAAPRGPDGPQDDEDNIALREVIRALATVKWHVTARLRALRYAEAHGAWRNSEPLDDWALRDLARALPAAQAFVGWRHFVEHTRDAVALTASAPIWSGRAEEVDRLLSGEAELEEL